MSASQSSQTVPSIQTLFFSKERQIDAPIDIVFQTVLEPAGPLAGMSLKIEPWPGGRWFRDLGNNTGHLWGHVQVIKPPKLLEICGPMMMSYAATSHIQYRLVEEGTGTRLTFTHQAIGLIQPEHFEGLPKGWNDVLEKIAAMSEGRK